MKDTAIGEIYFSFSTEELNKLDKYIESSRWVSSENVVKCHSFFANTHRENLWQEVDKTQLFQYIYGNQEYNDSKLRFTLNRLLGVIKEYIVVESLHHENVYSNKIWTDFLTEKKLKKNIKYSLNRKLTFNNRRDRMFNDYFKNDLISYYYRYFEKNYDKQKIAIENVLKSLKKIYDLFFIKIMITLSSYQKVYGVKSELYDDETFDQMDFDRYGDDPVFRMNYYNMKFRKENNFKAYSDLKSIFFESFDEWTDEEKSNIIIGLINYNSEQINKGDNTHIDRLYELYQLIEERGVFNIKGFTTAIKINNVLSIFLKKGEIQKSKQFLEKYKTMLPEAIKSNCDSFNRARILYHEKLFKESMEALAIVDYSNNFALGINAKILLMKNLYELGESDALDSLFDSFKKYLGDNKKKVPPHFNSRILKFINYVKNSYSQPASKLKIVKEKLLQEDEFEEKDWVIKKIDEKLQ